MLMGNTSKIRPQIGDWFSFHDAVDSNVRQWTVSDYVKYSDEGIGVMILTQTLLLLNGFKKIDEGCYLYHKDNIKIWLYRGMDVYTDGGNYRLPFPSFVHKFQQNLRICGLVELADNFKVK